MEREREARQKIKDLREWFETEIMPAGPVKVNASTNVVDVKLFISSNLSRMESMELRSKTLQAAYLHLTEFKIVVENAIT